MDLKKQVKLYLTIMFLFLASIVFFLSNAFVEPTVTDFFTGNILKKSTKAKDIASKDIVLVVIDEDSLNQVRWPWPRSYYSKIFDFLENKAGAKVILFDAVITSPDPYTQKSDEEFYDYIKKANKLVLGFDLCKGGGSDKAPCKVIQKNLYPDLNKKIKVNIEDKRGFKPKEGSYTGVMYMQPDFIKSAKNLGTVIVMDREIENIKNDRVIRTYSNVVYYNKKYYPSLALAGYSQIMGEKDYELSATALNSKTSDFTIRFPVESIKSQSSYTYLKWYKPYEKSPYYTHKAYSALDVLNLANETDNGKNFVKSSSGEVITPDLFKDKIVFVGANASAQSLDDRLGSPVLLNHAGVDIQATALNNYMDGVFSTKANLSLNILISVVVLLISFAAICYLHPMVSLTANMLILFICLIVYTTALSNDYILNFITIFFLEILLFAFAYIYQFSAEGEKKAKIQKAMGKYLSVDVMQKVVKNIDDITLGGKKVQATIMFIDIRRFTTISEYMQADEVSTLLNEYFATIYPIITKYNGVLNKFIGDAVLAIFDNEENHAKSAILCANEVLIKVKQLQQKWINESKPKIDVGVGINSGELFIGNIGTQERMEYTVIGDTVNTASRIEGYNKIYKTKFLIGESTYQLVKSLVDVIKINQVSIRGKSQKVNIYEVLRIRK